MPRPLKSPPVLEELMHRAEEFARREPARAVVSAFGAGFILNLLPLGAIASALTGILSSLTRPALLCFGLYKACECWRDNSSPSEHHD